MRIKHSHLIILYLLAVGILFSAFARAKDIPYGYKVNAKLKPMGFEVSQEYDCQLNVAIHQYLKNVGWVFTDYVNQVYINTTGTCTSSNGSTHDYESLSMWGKRDGLKKILIQAFHQSKEIEGEKCFQWGCMDDVIGHVTLKNDWVHTIETDFYIYDEALQLKSSYLIDSHKSFSFHVQAISEDGETAYFKSY